MVVAIPVQPGRLRTAAEEIERRTGLRVQIIGGSLVMSPTPRGKHAGTVTRLRLQLDPLRGAGFGAYENSSIARPDDADDYVTPDLAVLPVEWEDADEWLAEPQDVVLSVEVLSKSERSSGIADKIEWYAQAGVGILLILDPRHGTWTLHTHPRHDAYQGVLHGEYGEDVPLLDPLPALKTTDLPVYGV
jgi:Uma2 family endonuclease